MKNETVIKNLINTVNSQQIKEFKNEIEEKESWVINNVNHFDETHTSMVQNFIINNKVPKRPETVNELMIQFVTSAFSYNRIRKQFRKINRECFNKNNYPIKDDYKYLLTFIFDDKRFERDEYWQPEKFKFLITDIEKLGKYKSINIFSDYWMEHIMKILRTGPAQIQILTENGINQFYSKIDRLSSAENNRDVFDKSEKLWSVVNSISTGIINVGPNLTCDFLKESGFTDFVKIDVHMLRNMKAFLSVNNCTELSVYSLFLTSLWLAEKIKMTPFRLDKILYVYGVYHK